MPRASEVMNSAGIGAERTVAFACKNYLGLASFTETLARARAMNPASIHCNVQSSQDETARRDTIPHPWPAAVWRGW
jgi:hypothetical protein